MKRLIAGLLLLVLVLSVSVNAQTPDRPLILPMQDAPSPQTWLLGQVYGNTTGAFNFGDRWYSAGQGLHFGLDFSAACGAPLVAVADGEVAFVDNLNFGSAPHNLILRHPQIGLTTLYGHLLEPADVGLVVRDIRAEQQQAVGKSMDFGGMLLGMNMVLLVAGLALRDAVAPPKVPGSAHAAQRYVDYRSTPMTEITELFTELVLLIILSTECHRLLFFRAFH